MTHFYCVYCFQKFPAPDHGRAVEFCSPRCRKAQTRAEAVESAGSAARNHDRRCLFVEIGGGRMRKNLGLSDES